MIMMRLRFSRSFQVALLATNALVACGPDDSPPSPRPEDDTAGAGGESASPNAGNAGATNEEAGAAGSGGEPELGCCREGVACAAGQAFCAVKCPDSELECAAGEVCQQASDGELDRCSQACDPASRCGEVCCAAGATCSDGACQLADLTISAQAVAAESFGTVEVSADSCEIQEGCFNDSGLRSVVSLSARIENVGDAPFHLGAPWDSPLFYSSPCEDAYVLPNFIRAEVLSAGDEVIADGYLPTSCIADGEGEYRCTLQGLEAGAASDQPKYACNTLDLTGLAAGTYQLRLTVNPDRDFGETDFENNSVVVELEKPDCEGQICGGVCCPSDVDCYEGMCMLPDLRVNQEAIEQTLFIGHETFGEDSCEMSEMCVSGSGRRRLLQFEGRIENWGPGDLAPGEEQNNPLFEFSACHSHYHFLDFTDYRLLAADGSVAAQGHKQSFCLVEMDPVEGATVPAPYGTHPEPGLGGCNHLGAGWADIYGVGTPCQWVDITDVPPGDYTLQVAVNPVGTVSETSIANNIVQVPVQILEDTPCDDVETCGDNIDQDCDNVPDDWDPDCYDGGGDWETIEGNLSCETPYELTGSGQFQVELDGDASSVSPACGGQGGDAFFSFTLEESEVVFASTEYSEFDTVLALYQADCSGEPLVCSDDDCGQAAHLARLLEPGTYVLVAKAKDAEAAGSVRLTFEKTAVTRGSLLEGPGIYAGDTSASEDGVGLSCGFDDGGDCCQPDDPCNWADDGFCDCDNVFGWDDADCGSGGSGGSMGTGGKGAMTLGIVGSGGAAGSTGSAGSAGSGSSGGSGGSSGTGFGSPDDVYFFPACAGTLVQASTCGTSSYDSALAIYTHSIDYPLACSLTDQGVGTNWCSADPNGASVGGMAYDSGAIFVVVDAETTGASGGYQLYVSY
jgi:hypothetical protein